MAISPAAAKPQMRPEDEALSVAAEAVIDAFLPNRSGPSVMFFARAAEHVPEGANPETELGPLTYAALLDVAQKYRALGWHVYADWKTIDGIDRGSLKIVQP